MPNKKQWDVKTCWWCKRISWEKEEEGIVKREKGPFIDCDPEKQDIPTTQPYRNTL
jgi:hypothetical protein